MTVNQYDILGNLVAETDASGRQTYTYDAGGRLTLVEETLDGHTTRLAYQYNGLGDVLSTTQTVSGTSWTVQYAYDYPGGVYTVTYPSGAVRRYELDALGRPDAVKDGGSAIADYVYTDTAGYATVAYGNGLTTRVEYDRLGRTTLITSPVGGYAYGYDGAGNRLWMQRQHKTGQPYDVYEYDALYQLTQTWYGVTTTDPQDIAQREYALDLLGNRLWVQADGVVSTYTLQPGGMNRYSQAATTTLSYDARGNVLNDGLRGYGYDPLNRMTSAGSAAYLYDAFGRRVARTVGGATTFYVYDTQGRVLEEWRDGNWVSRYTYGAGVDEVLALETVTTTYYYHRDALGSITEVTDSSGNLVERYEYDVYGKPVIYAPDWSVRVVSIIGNRYLFTGREYDAETGNYFYRARYYSPRLGRFLSQDPIGYAAGDYNLYRYVFNNSVNLVDPSGMWVETVFDVMMLGLDFAILYYDISTYQQLHPCASVWEYLATLGVDFLALGVDLVLAAIPIAPAGGGGLNLLWRGSELAVQATRVTVSSLKGVRIVQSSQQLINRFAKGGGSSGVRNPGGSKGGTPHRSKVSQEAAKLDSKYRGQPVEIVEEYYIPGPGGGKLGSKKVDLAVLDADGNVIEFVQVGVVNKNGVPVARERKSLDIIQRRTGIRPRFVPYKIK